MTLKTEESIQLMTIETSLKLTGWQILLHVSCFVLISGSPFVLNAQLSKTHGFAVVQTSSIFLKYFWPPTVTTQPLGGGSKNRHLFILKHNFKH